MIVGISCIGLHHYHFSALIRHQFNLPIQNTIEPFGNTRPGGLMGNRDNGKLAGKLHDVFTNFRLGSIVKGTGYFIQ